MFTPTLGNAVRREILDTFQAQPTHPLGALNGFDGSGVYALYYTGAFPHYAELVRKNGGDFKFPIYVGQALKGARTGSSEFGRNETLFQRLQHHAGSIGSVTNLDVSDFRCRYLTLPRTWITATEIWLFDDFRPLWNVKITGFGNCPVGSNRQNQKAPPWDVLHPGRDGMGKGGASKGVDVVGRIAKVHLEPDPIFDLLADQ